LATPLNEIVKKEMLGLNGKKNKKKYLMVLSIYWLMFPFLHYQTLQNLLKLNLMWVY